MRSPTHLPMALVPCREAPLGANGSTSTTKRSSVLRRRSTCITLGALQPDSPQPQSQAQRRPVPSHWRPPIDTGGGLERSELGSEITAEVRRWLLAETSGPQCSQVVLDRALTVLSNFKLASGCQLEVLGGPLGAIVGGYSDADWLHDEVFRRQPADAIRDAFALLGFRARADGDWSSFVSEEISLAYRRMCLRGHPSRGGAPRAYLKLQVAMELVRAFAGEAGPLEPARGSLDGFVLNDLTLARELQLSAKEAEEEAGQLSQEHLEEMNRALDEYILRQMCFKSEIVDEIARLHEDSAYAILGVSSDATDAEIKRAYRLVAMQCHPDKGGDKEDFQELNNAYEKIMEQRRTVHDDKWRGSPDDSDKDEDQSDAEDLPGSKPKAKAKAKSAPDGKGPEGGDKDGGQGGEEKPKAGGPEAEGAQPEGAGDAEEEQAGEEGSGASLVEKAAKAAEEASRYAKTAAEFAHQAADAAETARQGREKGSHDTLTKSVAHSAIVLTLTVVKAVRVVGYATLDVAAQCRVAAKRNPAAAACAERSATAMTLGLEALNSALACAEVTETTAAELQAPAPAPQDGAAAGAGGSTAAAERFVGAAVRASLAAASASNAAMSAAIAAVEGSRQCAQAVAAKPSPGEGAGQGEGGEPSAEGRKEAEAELDEEEPGKDEAPEDEQSEPPSRRAPPSPEEAAASAVRRLVAQRNNNHKVLKRLNAEILGHQKNVRQFLQQNRQLIPVVSGESKRKIVGLLHDYAQEARSELQSVLFCAESGLGGPQEILAALGELPMLVPFLQPQNLAIPVSVKARVLKMAALYDLPLTTKVIDEEVFGPVRAALGGEDWRKRVDEISNKVRSELCSNVAEEGAELGGQTPAAATPASFGGPSPKAQGSGAAGVFGC